MHSPTSIPLVARRGASLAALALCLAGAPATAPAQILDALRALPGLGSTQAKPAAAGPSVDDAPPVAPNAAVAGEMSPDILCARPAERFNLAEKVAQYGGTAAALRLQRLITTDFAYSNLTPEDKKLLQYLAHTTVWLPAEAEAKLGAIYDTATGLFNFNKPSLTDDQLLAQDAIRKRLEEVRAQVPDYPADIRLTVDKTLPDGALARFGGVIVLSEKFLNGLEDAGDGAAFLLAHELSHVYKRHAIKNLQFQLISSSEGWQLARLVLQRAQRGMDVDPIADGVFLFRVMPQLVEFVKSTQIKFRIDQELEADACSVVWLERLKLSPQAAWEAYHTKLGAQTAYSNEHPSSAEREARFLRRASGTPKSAATLSPDKGTVKEGGKKIMKDAQQKK